MMKVLFYYLSIIYIFLRLTILNLFISMKVDLTLNSGAPKQKSFLKQLKLRQRQMQSQMRQKRMRYETEKPEINIQVIDPLRLQIRQYRQEQTFKKTHDVSKASQVLKKYIIQQQKNLRCVRLDRFDSSSSISPKKRPQLKLETTSITDRKQKAGKSLQQINIPLIEETFKNQHKQYILYESKLMKNQITRAISLIDNGVAKLKNYPFKGLSNAPSTFQSRKGSVAYSNAMNLNPELNKSEHPYDEYQIDKILQKKLIMSKKLRDKMYTQKKRMSTIQQMEDESPVKSLSYISSLPKKPKKKIYLKGIKSVPYKRGQQQIKVTPGCSLLFDLNKISLQRQKRQEELSQLLHNSYHNRQTILSQKSIFYEQSNSFNDLSPSNQFKLRKQMDKKLQHTIQITKEQINKFVAYLTQIKNYHVIINETILSILKEVRVFLLAGRVMKLSDLEQIISTKNRKQLSGYPNELIVQKLSEMMI